MSCSTGSVHSPTNGSFLISLTSKKYQVFSTSQRPKCSRPTSTSKNKTRKTSCEPLSNTCSDLPGFSTSYSLWLKSSPRRSWHQTFPRILSAAGSTYAWRRHKRRSSFSLKNKDATEITGRTYKLKSPSTTRELMNVVNQIKHWGNMMTLNLPIFLDSLPNSRTHSLTRWWLILCSTNAISRRMVMAHWSLFASLFWVLLNRLNGLCNLCQKSTREC